MIRWIAAVLAMLCAITATTGMAQSVAGPRHMLLLLRSENGRVRLVASREVPGALPRAEARDATQGWSFEALNDKNEVVLTGNLPDPHVVRGVFKNDKGNTDGVALSTAQDQTFAVRVPYGCKALVIYGASVRAFAALGKGKAAAVLGRINL